MDARVINTESLGQKVYRDLRHRLIVGDLSPGDTLSIRTLAEEFGVSAMPVREALKRLEYERALIGSAKRAYRVPVATPAVVSNLFFVRATLEAAAAELAGKRITRADLAQMRKFSDMMETAWRDGDSHKFLLNNFNFHDLIYLRSGNEDLGELARSLFARSGPWLGVALRRMAVTEDWATEHHRIIDAFEARDFALVRGLIEADANWGTRVFDLAVILE